MDWNDIRHFLALARSGSVRAAGASLQVSHSTVARRVEALEGRLATRLFDRTRDGYTLTDAGRQMMPSAERVELEMAALERDMVGQDERLSGVVALTCCDSFIAELLMPELSAFCGRYPQIELNVTSDSRPFDLSKREADIAIRAVAMGALPPEHLIGQRLAPLTMASYVSRAHKDVLSPNDPKTRWISFEGRKLHESIIAQSAYPQLAAWGSFSSLELMVLAARHGMGLIMLPTYVGDRDLTLQRLPRADVQQMAELWLLCHPDLRDNARFRAVRRLITQTMTRHAALFRGECPSDETLGPKITPSDSQTAALG